MSTVAVHADVQNVLIANVQGPAEKCTIVADHAAVLTLNAHAHAVGHVAAHADVNPKKYALQIYAKPFMFLRTTVTTI